MAVLKVGGNPYHSLMEQYQHCLSLPLNLRCSRLTTLLAEAPPKDLKQLYRVLVEEIFGFHHKNDWGLLMMESPYNVTDIQSLRRFLTPEGPLLQIAYKLSEDPQAVYNFPVSCLPAPTRQSLTQGIVPNFYSKKISCGSDGTPGSCLHLNAFEFLIFQFAYFIVNPASKAILECSRPQNTLYTALVEDYLYYFLRIDGTVPEAPITPPSSAMNTQSSFKTSPNKSWTTMTSPNLNRMDYPLMGSGFQTTPQRTIISPKPSLLKMDAFLSGNFPPNDISGMRHGHASPEVRTWRSEVFIEIMTEMYLNQYIVEFPQKFSPIVETFIPNVQHVWTIRVFIKHIHWFSNSLLLPQNRSEFITDPFINLKSYLIPHYIHKKMFIFFKVIFQHWPLDSTFRAPLETWLSYIQPWRYIPLEGKDPDFVSRWQKFVTENLQFYTPFFVQVLLRLFRMDLTSIKNAYMLFRVTKVFSQEHVDTMIIEAEKSHFGNIKSLNLHPSSPMTPSFMSSSFNSTFPKSDFSLNNYVPLFSPEVVNQVSRLLMEIVSAKQQSATGPSEAHHQHSNSFLSQVSSWFENSPPHLHEPDCDDIKVDVHLERSALQLCKLFKIPMPSIAVHRPNTKGNTSSIVSSGHNQSEQDQAFLMKRLLSFNGRITQKIIFKGNPDTQPTRTYEIDSLVKIYREISEFLNAKYASQINELYNKPSVLGRMCQQICAPPTNFPEIVKSKNMMLNSQKIVHLPPRILLRHFASVHVIRNYILYFAFMYFAAGLHPILACLLLFVYKVFMVFTRAVFHLHKPASKEN